MSAVNKDVIEAVKGRLGIAQDDLYRAKAKFRGMTAEQLAQEHGQSGETRASTLAGYEAEVARWRRALADAGGTET